MITMRWVGRPDKDPASTREYNTIYSGLWLYADDLRCMYLIQGDHGGQRLHFVDYFTSSKMLCHFCPSRIGRSTDRGTTKLQSTNPSIWPPWSSPCIVAAKEAGSMEEHIKCKKYISKFYIIFGRYLQYTTLVFFWPIEWQLDLHGFLAVCTNANVFFA